MTKLFRNSSPGALTREQAVAFMKNRVAERRRQMQQVRELAAQGRGEDTEIAHVARGEFVVPEAMQTPEVLAALRQAAADVNIPFDRLRIGSASNSINPETGVPEFTEYPSADWPIEEIVVSGSLITDDPSTNRKIEGLHPAVRYETAKFINDVDDRMGQQLRIPDPSGFRTPQEQDKEYAKGRTAPGQIVTHAPGGRSYHNYGLAFDVVGLDPDGKTPNYGIDIGRFAPIAKERGFEWGGNWAGDKRDPPHFQRTYGYTTDQLRQMIGPGATYPTIPGRRNR